MRGSIATIVALSWATGGWAALAILLAAACVGELPGRLEVRRSQLMACLMLPVVWRGLAGGM